MTLIGGNGQILAGRRARLLLCLVAVLSFSAGFAAPIDAAASKTLLTAGLASGAGSTVGPDGALYVTVGATGQVVRIDPKTGAKAVFASGLPPAIVGLGGAFDVEFIDGIAYVLVTVVGSDVGGHSVVGIYRRDGPHDFTVIADIGAFAAAHPPTTSYFIPTGVQYAMERYRGGFLVTDGHHNRVYRVTLAGQVSEVVAFNDIVPTGLAVRGNTVYMAEAGPNPHLPHTGRIVAFETKQPHPVVVAAGGRLLVDAEFSGGSLYGLSQGDFPVGSADGSPAMHNTGSLLKANSDGTFSTVITGLDQPTSVEFIGTSAYVVTLGGEVWKIANARGPGSGVD
jgi:hypothetical protein